MSTEPFLGEIKTLGFYFAPRGYMLCAGQTLSIAQYSALYALLGTTYGGDGIQTFKLPDLQGRIPIGQGQGPGLPDYTLGEAAGSPTATMTTANMPAHIHTLSQVSVKIQASTASADEQSPVNNFPATAGASVYSGNGATPNVFTGGAVISGTTDITGSGFPFSIMNPYLVLNYSIAVEGIFPSRN
ncbi:MAG: phage tail protein [Bacteroidetes bacterium]|nr:phage tail protein [Bacteroidota bacterium]